MQLYALAFSIVNWTVSMTLVLLLSPGTIDPAKECVHLLDGLLNVICSSVYLLSAMPIECEHDFAAFISTCQGM